VWIRERENETFSECVQNDGQSVRRPVAARELCHFETSADPTQQKFPPEITFAIRRDWLKMVALSQGPGQKPNHSPEAQRPDCRLSLFERRKTVHSATSGGSNSSLASINVTENSKMLI
jgi:hypothetical protein